MKKQYGFSLIEILVVVSIIGVITTVTTGIFVQIIKSSNKANVVTEIKQNGDSVMNQIERTIRNAEDITSVGKKKYGQSWSSTSWTDKDFLTSQEVCTGGPSNTSFDVCAIILKNQASIGGYTKIEIHQESDKECASAPFTASDQEVIGGNTVCNGNIRFVTDTTEAALDNLKQLNIGYTGVTSTTIGQIVTNTEKRSGISVKAALGTDNVTLLPFFAIRTSVGRPTVVTIAYSISQGIAASSRSDSTATIPFLTTISLRNY